MVKHTLKILRLSHRKIFKVCLTIQQHYEIKVKNNLKIKLKPSLEPSFSLKGFWKKCFGFF